MTKQYWRFFRLLWEFDARWLIIRAFFVMASSLIPLGQLLIAKQIIDEIVTPSIASVSEAWAKILTLIIIESLLALSPNEPEEVLFCVRVVPSSPPFFIPVHQV